MDTHSRSFAKAISWRITGTVDTLVISLIITQSIKLAATIRLTEVVTKSFLYYAHERAWLDSLRAQRPSQTALEVSRSAPGEEDGSPAAAVQPKLNAPGRACRSLPRFSRPSAPS